METVTTLPRLVELLRVFASERDWAQFHTRRNLALAVVGEVGELVEPMQFRTDEEVTSYASTPEGHRELADELSDVLIYLVRLADVLEIDLGAAAVAKIEANAEKYPAAVVKGRAEKRH